jgi:hypothetical protein
MAAVLLARSQGIAIRPRSLHRIVIIQYLISTAFDGRKLPCDTGYHADLSFTGYGIQQVHLEAIINTLFMQWNI